MALKLLSGDALVRSVIAYQHATRERGIISLLIKKVMSMRYHLISIATASDVSRDAQISSDLKLPHPVGVVIHRDSRIGSGCMIMQLVTVGTLADGAAPSIGNGVYIGAGAKVLGGITIGDNAKIGANAVVLIDIPENATAIGVPARIITT